MNVFFTGSVGNDLLNVSRIYLNNGVTNYYGVIFNQTNDWYNNRWTKDKPHDNILYPGVQHDMPVADINSTMIENGSYFRLKNLTFSYGFPNIKHVKNLKVFITGTNLFTITEYKGFDPEVSSFSQSLLQQGIDYGSYPTQRSYTFGLSCNF